MEQRLRCRDHKQYLTFDTFHFHVRESSPRKDDAFDPTLTPIADLRIPRRLRGLLAHIVQFSVSLFSKNVQFIPGVPCRKTSEFF